MTMAAVEDVEIVVAHSERATLRVGDVFLKIDADQTRSDVEVEAIATAPIPTPRSCGENRPCLRSLPFPGQRSVLAPLLWRRTHPLVAVAVCFGTLTIVDSIRSVRPSSAIPELPRSRQHRPGAQRTHHHLPIGIVS